MTCTVVVCPTCSIQELLFCWSVDCCIHRTCWCFTTKGMDAVGQDEIVVLLETLPEENQIPYDVFYHLMDIYEEAGRGELGCLCPSLYRVEPTHSAATFFIGNTVSGMGHTVFTRSFLGSKDHGGFLFLHPSFQCLQKIPLPPSPFLFAVLLQKWEIPWAKVFPLRLLLRLGAEFRYYPAPLVGIRFRKPVYCEIGHTIMNLLAVSFLNRFTSPVDDLFIGYVITQALSFSYRCYFRILGIISIVYRPYRAW